ncbi:MAG: hypothetical protein ACM31C_02965 [Acidobacteriota bacterium]
MLVLVLVLVLDLVGCAGGHGTPRLDGPPTPDAPAIDAAIDAPKPYRHTIVIDGMDDFAPADTFATTSSPSYAARITWDDHFVYVGYSGPDLATTTTDASSKWLFVYFDLDPGAGTGAATSLTYNTQHATFPTGFGAELYARYKCDDTFVSLERYDAGSSSWTTVSPTPLYAQGGPYVELAIPLAELGAGAKLGIVTWMINEKALAEGSYAGLYADNFTDGYAMNLPLAHYLLADFTSPRAPNDQRAEQ